MAARVITGCLFGRRAGSFRGCFINTARRSLAVSSACRSPDKVTHTGQKWEDDDYRNIRFTDRDKQDQFMVLGMRLKMAACASSLLAVLLASHHGDSLVPRLYRVQAEPGNEATQVNERFAIDLLAEEPVVVVRGNHTWCDGGRGALGHPKVYINLDRPEIMDCGYCGKRFLGDTHKQLFSKENLSYEDV